jgi:hypothetical protein
MNSPYHKKMVHIGERVEKVFNVNDIAQVFDNSNVVDSQSNIYFN